MAAGDPLSAYVRDRRRMVERLRGAGVEDLRILHAFDTVPRHHFVPSALHGRAYEDAALPIGHGQTISRPSVHALHLALVELGGGERVLEIGTGSGFQTALLLTLGCEVYSVERIPALRERAATALAELGLEANLRAGDGGTGWPAAAPFEAILVGAAGEQVPPALLEQLAPGGRLVAPIRGDGEGEQHLVRLQRTGDEDGWERERVDEARFVPLVEGVAGE